MAMATAGAAAGTEDSKHNPMGAETLKAATGAIMAAKAGTKTAVVGTKTIIHLDHAAAPARIGKILQARKAVQGRHLIDAGATETTIHQDRAAGLAQTGRILPDLVVVPEVHPAGAATIEGVMTAGVAAITEIVTAGVAAIIKIVTAGEIETATATGAIIVVTMIVGEAHHITRVGVQTIIMTGVTGILIGTTTAGTTVGAGTLRSGSTTMRIGGTMMTHGGSGTFAIPAGAQETRAGTMDTVDAGMIATGHKVGQVTTGASAGSKVTA